MNVYGINIYCI